MLQRFIALYKYKLHLIKWWILEHTLYPHLRYWRGLISALFVLVFGLAFAEVITPYLEKINSTDLTEVSLSEVFKNAE